MLKSELSHLMREVSCPSFIGGAWSEAQLMRQKIWTHASDGGGIYGSRLFLGWARWVRTVRMRVISNVACGNCPWWQPWRLDQPFEAHQWMRLREPKGLEGEMGLWKRESELMI